MNSRYAHVALVAVAAMVVPGVAYTAALAEYHDTVAYYPAYMTEALDPNKTIDLTIENAAIKIYINDTTLGGNVDLQGGQVRFFIGEWDVGILEGPEDDRWAFFCRNLPFVVNDHSWTTESTVAAGGDADWQRRVSRNRY